MIRTNSQSEKWILQRESDLNLLICTIYINTKLKYKAVLFKKNADGNKFQQSSVYTLHAYFGQNKIGWDHNAAIQLCNFYASLHFLYRKAK